MQEPECITIAQITRIEKEVTRLSDPRRPYFSKEHEARLISGIIPGKTSRYDLTLAEATRVITALSKRKTVYTLRSAEFATPSDRRRAR